MVHLYGLVLGLLLPLLIESKLLFNGDFETGDLKQWATVQVCNQHPPRIAVYSKDNRPAPDAPTPREGKYACRFMVYNSDVAPCTPTDNPRAQLLTNEKLFLVDDEAWEGWSIFFPIRFPRMNSSGGWFLFQEDYGPPYDGSPSLGWDVGFIHGEERITLNRGAPRYDSVWSIPLVRGRWFDFIVHKKFSSLPDVGFVEAFVNGQAIKFAPCDGCTKLFTPTLHPSMHGNGFFLNSYRQLNLWPTQVDLYFDSAKVGQPGPMLR